MTTTVLREEDGAYKVLVPQTVIDELHLHEGATMDVSVEEQKVILQSHKPQYSLEQLLREHAEIADQLPEDRAWIDAPRVGRELV